MLSLSNKDKLHENNYFSNISNPSLSALNDNKCMRRKPVQARTPVNFVNSSINADHFLTTSTFSTNTTSPLQNEKPLNSSSSSSKMTIKANIRDSQWIKDNILRSLQVRKPLATAATFYMQNAFSNAPSHEKPVSSESVTISELTPNSTANNGENSTSSTATYQKVNGSQSNTTLRYSLFHHSFRSKSGSRRSNDMFNNKNSISSENFEQHDFLNTNRFQKLCDLATKWNDKGRFERSSITPPKSNTQKPVETKDDFSARQKDGSENAAVKKKPRRSRTLKAKNSEEIVVENGDCKDSKIKDSKIIAKNFVQLRPVDEVDVFTHVHYAFNHEPRKVYSPVSSLDRYNFISNENVKTPKKKSNLKWSNSMKNPISTHSSVGVS